VQALDRICRPHGAPLLGWLNRKRERAFSGFLQTSATGRQRSFHLAKNALRLASTSALVFGVHMSLKSALISSCRCLGVCANRLCS
jgi:hypothetical protein